MNAIFLDTETTGLDLERSDIIEIGAVRVVDGRSVDAFSSLIKTDQVISEKTLQLNGISKQLLLDQGQAPDEVFPCFFEFIKDHTLVAHNGLGFDFILLAKAFMRYGLPIAQNKLIDTLILASTFLSTKNNRFRLNDICMAYRIDNYHAHRALSDARTLSPITDLIEEKEQDFERLWQLCGAWDLKALSQAPLKIENLLYALRYQYEVKIKFHRNGEERWVKPKALHRKDDGTRWLILHGERKLLLDEIEVILQHRRPSRTKPSRDQRQ